MDPEYGIELLAEEEFNGSFEDYWLTIVIFFLPQKWNT